jgi:hypothetical protein
MQMQIFGTQTTFAWRGFMCGGTERVRPRSGLLNRLGRMPVGTGEEILQDSNFYANGIALTPAPEGNPPAQPHAAYNFKRWLAEVYMAASASRLL